MRKLLLAAGLLASSTLSQAAILDFSWSNGWQDIVSGYVDTKQNSLFITKVHAWSPGEYHYVSPLLPDFSNNALFPNNQWQLRATSKDGSEFDIADDWTGALNGQWGFTSDLAVDEIVYLNGKLPHTGNLRFYPGIAMAKVFHLPTAQRWYDTESPQAVNPNGTVFSSFYFYAAYPNLVPSPSSLDDFDATPSFFAGGGIYTVKPRNVVTEPTPVLLLLAGFTALLLRKRRLVMAR